MLLCSRYSYAFHYHNRWSGKRSLLLGCHCRRQKYEPSMTVVAAFLSCAPSTLWLGFVFKLKSPTIHFRCRVFLCLLSHHLGTHCSPLWGLWKFWKSEWDNLVSVTIKTTRSKGARWFLSKCVRFDSSRVAPEITIHPWWLRDKKWTRRKKNEKWSSRVFWEVSFEKINL